MAEKEMAVKAEEKTETEVIEKTAEAMDVADAIVEGTEKTEAAEDSLTKPSEAAEEKAEVAPFAEPVKKKRGRPKKNASKDISLEKEDEILKRTRPKKFIDDGSEVFTQNMSTKLEKELRKVDEALQRIIYAFQKPTYLSIRVSGVRHSSEHGLCALCYYGDEAAGETVYQVLIPFEKFTEITEEELEQRKITKDIFLERRIGSIIDFIPEAYEKDGNSFLFLGNRIAAMKMSCYEHWFATEKGKRNDNLKFNVGSKIEARIVGKYPRSGLRIEIFGVETLVPINELSYTFIPTDLSTIKYDVGDNIPVCITKLRRNLSPIDVEYSASVRRTRPDPRFEAFEKVQVGDSMHGTVSNITVRDDDITKSKIFVVLDGGGEAMCAKFNHEQIHIGDKVSVRIGNKYISESGEPRLEILIKHVFA